VFSLIWCWKKIGISYCFVFNLALRISWVKICRWMVRHKIPIA